MQTFLDAISTAKEIDYPVLVRPSYVLGGRGMEIVRTEEELQRYMAQAVAEFGAVVDPGAIFPERPLRLAYRHGYRVPGHKGSIPSLMNHLLVVDVPPAVLNQRAKRLKRLRSQVEGAAVS